MNIIYNNKLNVKDTAHFIKINNNFTKIVFSNKFKFTKINIIYFKKY